MSLSVVLVTKNEEANLGRTLESVKWADELVVVDSGSTDATVAIARLYGARIFAEDWKGYAAQKNSALDKATGDWILALDADEVVSPGLARSIRRLIGTPEAMEDVRSLSETLQISFSDRRFLRSLLKQSDTAFQPLDARAAFVAYKIPFKHHFLGHWLRFGGMYPDRKLRLFRRGHGRFKERAVHESVEVTGGATASLHQPILHYGYPTLDYYLASMERYSTLAAEQMLQDGRRPRPILDTVLRPAFTFFGRAFLLLGFLDGPAGLTYHFHHSMYVRAKYVKALALEERGRRTSSGG
jgi:glycosyltransferase involved in cell wall biosynthesis